MNLTTRDRAVKPCDLTIADAANLYLMQMFNRAWSAQVSWGHYRSCQHRLRRVVECMGEQNALSNVTKESLNSTILYFAQRPPCKKRKFQKKPADQPISLYTAKGIIAMVRALFVWLADHDQLTWERPRGFDRIFKLKDRRLKTPDEVAREARSVISGEVDTFTIAELTRLFRAARSRDRLYILLGLNCGFTSGEISSLHTFEVFLDADVPCIHKRRAKTGVEAKWSLWPETATMLRRHRAATNARHLWLMTPLCNQLVEVDEFCRRDAIDQSWKLLYPRVGLDRVLGFRFMRKTGADAIKRLGGLEESEMYLAHQESGLNKHYANRNWPKLWTCLERFRAQLPFLGPTWDLDPEECLFTQSGNPDWSAVNPPWVQKATKRSQSGMLNVSFHQVKRRFSARIYQKGETYCSGYFEKAEDAASAAKEIRRKLEAGIDPRKRRRKQQPE